MRYSPENTIHSAVVFLNGRELDRCVYADTKKGIARVGLDKIVVNRGKTLIRTKTLRGLVEVVDKKTGEFAKTIFDIRSDGFPPGWRKKLRERRKVLRELTRLDKEMGMQ